MKYSLDPGPIERYAVRILFILRFCHDQKDKNIQLSMFEPNEFTYSINSETKLQKIDFWVRYPDHLAAALIKGCEPGGKQGHRRSEVKDFVRQIFLDEEPTIRWVPMLKYLRGAYEPLDEVLSFLSSRQLAYRRNIEKGHRTRFFLTPKGNNSVSQMIRECPETEWYMRRSMLINSFFEHLNGFEIREMQYLEKNYLNTPPLKMIEQVESEVRSRFERLFGETL